MAIARLSSSLRDGEGRACRRARRVAAAAVLLGLAACNPVETWRDLTGVNRNDPDPENTPNSRNLAAGEASDYPNLATVPPPPIRAMTAAERETLTQSLIADRANARHTNEQLRAGFPQVSAAPLPPPPPSAGSASGSGDATAELSAPGAPPSPPPPPTQPAALPASIATSPSDNPREQAPRLPSATAAGPKRADGKTPAGPRQALRKQGETPEPGPMESSLEMPQARATPQPEEIQPAPPPPQLPPTAKAASPPSPSPSGLAVGGVLAAPPLRGGSGPAAFQPPPAAPELPPTLPSRSAAAGQVKSNPKPPTPAGTAVAEIKFGADSTSLSDKDRQTLETVLPMYQQNPGKVRIVGYAGAASGAVEQLNSYRAALDRAQVVAAALTQAGIPADKIQVEAAPADARPGEGRAEVLLEH
jgi:outer membrane protein OmpA-like peptidoglycan-associated protein